MSRHPAFLVPSLAGVMLGWVLMLSQAAWAQPNTGADFRASSKSLEQVWDDVKVSVKRGAYRDALASLDVIVAMTPEDPRVPLYRSLCEQQLQAPVLFGQLSSAQWLELSEHLRREEQAQRRAAAQAKVLQRHVRKEQARWDQELEMLERQAERDEVLKRQTVQAEAVRQARTQRAQERELAEQEAIRQPPTVGVEPSVPSATETVATTPDVEPSTATPTEGPTLAVSSRVPSVELAPVVVPTTPTPPREVPTPSLVGRPVPPPGAVQINAQQMSVSPDQRIAIAEGDVEVVFENAFLTCDHLTLFTDTKDAYAEGRVRLEEGAQVFRGEMAHYNFETKKGRFLQGTVSSPPWVEHGRSVEHIAEGVYQVTPGYITSCDLEPPHFKFYGRRAIVFSEDRLARMRNVALIVEKVPFFYLPWLSVADRQSPFFFIPGKKKPWEQFALMGYRYEWPVALDDVQQKGAVRLDWRRAFGWGVGLDHQLESPRLGRGLLKLYYNEEPNMRVRDPKAALPKGAALQRYRVLWRHHWQPLPDTTVMTDIQEYSDANFRRDLLFREEYTSDDQPESFISLVTNDPNFTLTGLVRKRVNRFQSVTEAFPDIAINTRSQQIGETPFFSESALGVANLQTKNAHSDNDTDVVRVDWFEQLRYALRLFRPIEVTPRAGIRQTYYSKDKQGGVERTEGDRDVFSGQVSFGGDASLKLFRIFPVATNAFGLNLNVLRHILTPTMSYSYVHEPTVANDLLNFGTASGPSNQLSFGVENKLQTKRPTEQGKLQAVDLARLLVSLPYTFGGSGNKQGGRLGDWAFDVELYPWPWLRVESDWAYPSHFITGSRDERVTAWNLDVVMVGGHGTPEAQHAPDIQAPQVHAFEAGPKGALVGLLLPEGQWYLGVGHRYSYNDKTEDVIQFDWRPSPKWEIGTFHRFTSKEVVGTSKRFNNVREYQYSLRRDLHDWLAELVYRVDREFGEELFLTLTLKAYPELPIETGESYHQPKIGSQSSPFSPIRVSTSGI